MKILITHKQSITAKKTGVEYVKLSFISPTDGKTGDIFTTKEQYDSFELKDEVMPKEHTKALSELGTIFNAEFDQDGHLLEIA